MRELYLARCSPIPLYWIHHHHPWVNCFRFPSRISNSFFENYLNPIFVLSYWIDRSALSRFEEWIYRQFAQSAANIAGAAPFSIAADAVSARSERRDVVGTRRAAVPVGHTSEPGSARALNWDNGGLRITVEWELFEVRDNFQRTYCEMVVIWPRALKSGVGHAHIGASSCSPSDGTFTAVIGRSARESSSAAAVSTRWDGRETSARSYYTIELIGASLL